MTWSYVPLQVAGEVVRDVVPPWLVPAFLGITSLGNVGVFMLLFTLDYWFGDHERGAHAIALLVAGMAAVTALKHLFAVPRPPRAVAVVPVTGYSFPSGHAMGSTIAYGVLAHDLKVGSVRQRYGVAGTLVALIALSRVVLGVHFVRDVLAGVVFGVAFLWIAIRITGHAPQSGYALAIPLAAVALLVSGFGRDSVVIAGAALGAAVVWESVGPLARVHRRPWQVALVGAGLPILAGLASLAIRYTLPLPAVFGLSVVLAAGILGAPGLVHAVEEA